MQVVKRPRLLSCYTAGSACTTSTLPACSRIETTAHPAPCRHPAATPCRHPAATLPPHFALVLPLHAALPPGPRSDPLPPSNPSLRFPTPSPAVLSLPASCLQTANTATPLRPSRAQIVHRARGVAAVSVLRAGIRAVWPLSLGRCVCTACRYTRGTNVGTACAPPAGPSIPTVHLDLDP